MTRIKTPRSNSLQLGRTIAGQRDRQETASERQLARQKAKNKKTISVVSIIAILFIIFILGIFTVRSWLQPKNYTVIATQKYEPTIEILDEDSSGYVTERMKEYVGRLEKDFKDQGYTATKAIIPSGKTREIDIYVDGREEYYKMNLDRDTAVSVEDAINMINYLSKHGITASYVDVRIAGKAFYK